MNHIKVFYTFAKKGDREKFLADVKEIGVDVKSRAENGCYGYDYYLPVNTKKGDYDNELLLIETWENDEAQAAHAQQTHFKQLGEAKAKYDMETKIEKVKD